uniref:CUB domain-containing protein n=1 Tax=Parastrongyloides trichosuri TaxID=131310 RepID=A0A0N4ZN84_PARTI
MYRKWVLRVYSNDILFDCKTRRARKFILHTNIPGQYDFGIYSRCHFNLVLEKEGIVIDPYSKFEEFNTVFACNDSDATIKPVVLNRGGPNEGENPFGATFCYGTEQMIFEVMENGHIGSIILFE